MYCVCQRFGSFCQFWEQEKPGSHSWNFSFRSSRVLTFQNSVRLLALPFFYPFLYVRFVWNLFLHAKSLFKEQIVTCINPEGIFVSAEPSNVEINTIIAPSCKGYSHKYLEKKNVVFWPESLWSSLKVILWHSPKTAEIKSPCILPVSLNAKPDAGDRGRLLEKSL